MNPLVQARDLAGGAVLLDTMTGECFELNRVGAEVWRGIAVGQALPQVVDAVCLAYGVARDRIEADVLSVLEDLARRGLVKET